MLRVCVSVRVLSQPAVAAVTRPLAIGAVRTLAFRSKTISEHEAMDPVASSILAGNSPTPFILEDNNPDIQLPDSEISSIARKLPDLTQHVLRVHRTIKVTRGGKNMHYKALVVVGDERGRGGFGYASGLDTRQATDKATKRAQQVFMQVPLYRNRVLFHDVYAKYNATKVMVGRAPYGQGITAGRVQYLICNALGIRDAVCKIWGSSNEANVVRATFLALSKARSVDQDCQMRGVDRRRIVMQSDDNDFDRRLYEGGNFSFHELTGRVSKYAGIGYPVAEGYEIYGLDGKSLPAEEGRPRNTKFDLWDEIAAENERRFWLANPAMRSRLQLPDIDE